jgi:hypothetical protein
MSGLRRRTGSGNGKTSRKEKIMDYVTWMKHKDALQNESWIPWAKWPDYVQKAMSSVEYEHREHLNYDGMWMAHAQGGFYCGTAYRVSPTWPGPAKPEPKPEYEDKNVFRSNATYRFIRPEIYERWLLTTAPAMVGFVGYVYEADGKCKIRPRLLFDQQSDGTYRVRVPKAVRFVKGATA